MEERPASHKEILKREDISQITQFIFVVFRFISRAEIYLRHRLLH